MSWKEKGGRKKAREREREKKERRDVERAERVTIRRRKTKFTALQ